VDDLLQMKNVHSPMNKATVCRTYPLILGVFGFTDNVVIFSEKDEYDKLKATPQKTVKR